MRARTILAVAAALMLVSEASTAEARGRGGRIGAFVGVHVLPGGRPAMGHGVTAPKAELEAPTVRATLIPATARSDASGTGAASHPATAAGGPPGAGARFTGSEQAEATPKIWCPSGRVVGSGIGFCEISSAL